MILRALLALRDIRREAKIQTAELPGTSTTTTELAEMVPTPNTAQFLEAENDSSSTQPGYDSALGYFDRAPDSQVVLPPRNPRTESKPSTAEAKEKKKGIYSHDQILNQNADELWRFLVSDLRPPRMSVYVTGEHTTQVTSTGANGQTTTHSQTVTDFSILMDVSHYVIPHWSLIRALPASLKDHEKGIPVPTIRETLEEYTSSKNTFKEFRMKKLVLWDFERVTQLITDLVRSTGYRSTIIVHFPMEAYKVVVLASNQSSRAAHSRVVRVLCVVSCLCLVFWPAWAIARKRMKNRLECEYRMAVDANEFFSRNNAKIQSVVVRHSGEKLVAL